MLSSCIFILWVVLPIIAWILYRKFIPGPVGLFFAVILSLVIGYILYVSSVWIVDKEYEFALQKYDLDGNGEFSNEEYTSEAQAAMKKFTNDTGRAFAPVIAAPATVIWTSFTFVVLFAGTKIGEIFKTRREIPQTDKIG